MQVPLDQLRVGLESAGGQQDGARPHVAGPAVGEADGGTDHGAVLGEKPLHVRPGVDGVAGRLDLARAGVEVLVGVEGVSDAVPQDRDAVGALHSATPDPVQAGGEVVHHGVAQGLLPVGVDLRHDLPGGCGPGVPREPRGPADLGVLLHDGHAGPAIGGAGGGGQPGHAGSDDQKIEVVLHWGS